MGFCNPPFRNGPAGRGNEMERHRTIRIELDELNRKAGMTKIKLSHQAEMQRPQIDHYCRSEVTRLDTNVLARICTVMECEMGGLLE